ncbi:MAG: hypothetical protein WCJ49_01945, partial [Deltaproteobacteria bacterium]
NTSVNYLQRRDAYNGRNIETTYGIVYKQQCWNALLSYSEKTSVDITGAEAPDRVLLLLFNFYGLGGFGF